MKGERRGSGGVGGGEDELINCCYCNEYSSNE